MAYGARWVLSFLFMMQVYGSMAVIGLLGFPLALASRKGARFVCRSYCRWVIWTARWMVGIRTEVRGTPPEGNIMVAAKHQSFVDVMMILTALPAGKFIMKKEILRTPVIGQYAKLLNCVAIDRGKRSEAIKKMVADVAAGLTLPGQLIIYSQGTRIKPGVKAPYKVGTGVLYEQLGQVCVPVATNVGVLWPRKGIIRNPGLAVVEFLDPIQPGMPREAFMETLEREVEAASNRLMREAGFDPDGVS
jgi:1-acyl-sn-glycerol-3-phosphate acyltransferase